MPKFRQILSNGNFFALWLGQIVSEFGDRLTQMALVGLIYSANPYSAVALAKAVFFIVIPVFIIGPVAGAYVDRWDKRNTMLISDAARGILILLIPASLFIFKGRLVPVYILIFVVFSITRFFLPSKMAIVPDLVPKEQLLMANSLVSTTRMIATVIGLGVAGFIVKLAGPKGAFYIDAATFFFSALMISFIVKKSKFKFRKELFERTKAIEEALIRRNIFAQIKEGLVFLVRHKDVRFSLQSLFLMMAGLGALSVIAIVFVQESFHSATKDIGIFGMLIGAGLFFGSLGYGRLGSKISKKTMMNLSFAASGLLIIIFSLTARWTGNLLLSGMAAAALGAAASPIAISSNTLIHEAIPEEVRGRVFSSVELVIHLAFLACMFAAAKLADMTDKIWIMTGCGLMFVVFAVFRARRKTQISAEDM